MSLPVQLPYSDLPDRSFWRNARNDDTFLTFDLFQPKFNLEANMRVATAGSCFAQNVARYVRASNLVLVDVEPTPKLMRPETAKRFGYGLFSARYGNVYTARQFLQLLDDTAAPTVHDAAIWEKSGRYFDALRPNVEPHGFGTKDELAAHRISHLYKLQDLFRQIDVMVFTLGLTECWVDVPTGIVFPTAPGVIAGTYDPARHAFLNLSVRDTIEDLDCIVEQLQSFSEKVRVLLTVSPVPLTATATGLHVLRATTYSKSVLRAAAEEVSNRHENVDYFPSFEMITGTPYHGHFYDPNMRTVTKDGVETVMSVFFASHPDVQEAEEETGDELSQDNHGVDDEAICEEALLEAFARK